MEPTNDKAEAPRQALKVMRLAMAAVFAADGKACIYPWKDKQKVNQEGITKTSLYKFENYALYQLRETFINRGFFGVKRSVCSFGMHLGFEVTEAKVKKSFAKALREHGISLFSHHEFEHTLTLGYLKGSVRALDPQRIVDAIYADSGVQVVGRFRP